MHYYVAMRRTSGHFIEQERRFAARVRTVRVHRALSHQELADRVELNRMAISKIEAGTRRVVLAEALALADALGVPLADMLSPNPLVLVEQVRLD